MNLVITIDTEEDNWGRYSATDNPVENIERIVPLQKMFDEYGVRPTYLVTYPVATDPRSVAILKRILDEGKCEIGTHCHPWNTPPFDKNAVICERDTMLCNLPETLVLEKLATLHEAICRNYEIVPVSFRAGRWGFNNAVARALCKLGYRVDTSVSPFVNWGENHGPDFTRFRLHPYRFDPVDIYTPHVEGAMFEIPATVGFLSGNFERCKRWTPLLESSIGKKLRLKGIASRLGLLNKVWLSPELTCANSMIQLARKMKRENYPCLNMSFHSTTLMGGLNSFVPSREAEKSFLLKIKQFLAYAVKADWTTVCLKEMTGLPWSSDSGDQE